MPKVEAAHVEARGALIATVVKHGGVAAVRAGPLVPNLPRGNLHNAQVTMDRLLCAVFIIEIAALTSECAGFTA